MHTNYIQLPPDSTGKQLHVQRIILITVDDNSLLYKNEVFTTNVSNNEFKICEVVTLGSTHMVHAMFTSGASETLTEVSVGEQILVGGVPKATIVSPEPHYQFFNLNALVSADNPYNGQRVDDQGAALISFADGSPSVAQGSKLRTVEPVPIGTYDHASGPQNSLFHDVVTGAGEVVFDEADASMIIRTTTGATDSAMRQTNRYHYFQPGTGTFISIGLAHGDSGKAGNVRHWGVGDYNNGMMFGLHGTSLGVDVYSNTSGTIIERRTTQANWNVDRLDGTGPSRYDLDITKIAMYWIDYLWPTGSVRFGVFTNTGQRVICHVVRNSNVLTVPFTSISSFPVTVMNENKSLTFSSSEIRFIAAAVYSDGPLNYVYWRYSDMENTGLKIVTTNTPVLSVRPVQILPGTSLINRVQTYPEELSVFVTGGAVKIDLYSMIDTATMTGATWDIIGSSTLEGDEDCTELTGLSSTDGSKMNTQYVNAGASNISLREIFEVFDTGIGVIGDGTVRPAVCFVVTALTAAETKAQMTLSYRELS